MEIDIIEVDPKTMDRTKWEEYHDFRKQRHIEVSPNDEYPTDEFIERSMKQDSPIADQQYYLIYTRDGRMIGTCLFGEFKKGTENYNSNKHLIQVSGEILREYRRQGIGHQLLNKVVEIANNKSKELIMMSSKEESGQQFFRKIGAQMALEGAENRLQFDEIDWNMVKKWKEEGEKRNPSTTLTTYFKIPESLIEEYSKLMTDINNQQPHDDLELNEMTLTPKMVRERENQISEMGADMITMITKEEDGHISGLTEMLKIHEQKKLRQQFTGVKDIDRGRGLGKYLKAAMLLLIREKYPETTVITTGNANSNVPMLSINERLGFKTYKPHISAQIKTSELEKYLAQEQNHSIFH